MDDRTIGYLDWVMLRILGCDYGYLLAKGFDKQTL